MATSSLPSRSRWTLRLPRRTHDALPPVATKGWKTPTAIFLVAAMLAVLLNGQFLHVDRALWYNPYHDRSAHYLYSLKLATYVRNGDVLHLLRELNEARIWPPLHGIVAGGVLLIGGWDYRLAVLPSLIAWVATIVLGFLVARRAAPRGGTLAGLVAVVFLAASPAHRAYATDIMLESLGGALSLLAIYAYLLTVQGVEEEVGKARFLALSLLMLFLEKYNYWLLVVLALLAAEGIARSRLYLGALGDLVRRVDWRTWTVTQLRHPLNGAMGGLLLLSGIVMLRGEEPFALFGHSVSLYPPHNLIHGAYVLLFLRLLAWWRRTGRQWTRRLDVRLQQVIVWLCCPLAWWFLLPKRPSYFLWYLSLADRAPQQQMDILGGIRDYATWMMQDYHFNPATAWAAFGLCLVGLLSWRRLRPGGVAILTLVALACVLTPTHPNHKSRMLHSWIPAIWIASGLGAATLIDGLVLPRFRAWVAGAVVVGLAAMQAPAFVAHAHTMEGGPQPEQASMLDVPEAYLPDLDHSQRALLLSTLPLKPMAQWTYLQRYGSFARLEERWYGFGAAGDENRRGFAHWLQTTDCDTVVFVESTIAREGVDSGPECALHGELKDTLTQQHVFTLERERSLPHLACRVQTWRRK